MHFQIPYCPNNNTLCRVSVGHPYGYLNQLLSLFGVEKIDWYSKPYAWPVILTITSVWKGVGMDSVVYYASLMGIDTSLFEAAEVDGANKFQQFFHIILPSIKTILTLNIILSITGSLSAFEPPFVITKGANGTGTFFIIMDRVAHVSQKVGLASAMAVFLLTIILVATLVQNIVLKYLFRNSGTENTKGGSII